MKNQKVFWWLVEIECSKTGKIGYQPIQTFGTFPANGNTCYGPFDGDEKPPTLKSYEISEMNKALCKLMWPNGEKLEILHPIYIEEWPRIRRRRKNRRFRKTIQNSSRQ